MIIRMLHAENISKSYGEKNVLSEVSLSVEPGAACVVIGPSGAGKSTLLRCLGLLEHADRGSVTLDGKTYALPTDRTRVDPPWPDLTVVFQQHFLWPHLTLSENISLPLESRLSKPEIRRILGELIELFDMADFIGRYPNEASLGQRQRVALARAFALRPRYILLDEVTSSLDVEQIEKLFRHLIVHLSSGIGMVVVTHLLSFAKAIIGATPKSSIVFLDGGRVTASGGRELLESPPPGRVSEFIARMQLAT